jgi:hypothetical protein
LPQPGEDASTMPCKISEAQYGKVIEEMNLPYLVLALNGDPLDTEALDRFAYDLHEVHGKKLGKRLGAMPLAELREPTLVPVEALTARVRAARDSAEIN